VEVDYGHPNDLETEPTKGKISGDQNAVTEPEKIPDYAVHALLRLQRSTNQLLNTNIALANRAVLSQPAQFLVSGYLPQFNLTQWQGVLERYQNYTAQITARPDPQTTGVMDEQDHAPDTLNNNPTHIAGLPFRVNVTLGEHKLGVLTLKQLAINLVPQEHAWSLDLHNPLIAGLVHIPNEKTQPIDINLQYLHLADDAFGEETDTLSSLEEAFDPANLPLADIRVNELFYENKNYGKWSVQLRPIT